MKFKKDMLTLGLEPNTCSLHEHQHSMFQVLTAASMKMEAARTSEMSVDNYFTRQ
jgi:hypothetical protein